MTKNSKIISFIAGLLSFLASFIFLVIEGRLLFSGDYFLYADSTSGFFTIFFRFLLALLCLFLSIPSLLSLGKKKRENLRLYIMISSFSLFVIALILFIFLFFPVGEKLLYLLIPLAVIGLLELVSFCLAVTKKDEKSDSF
jgi:hypothetical protein